MSHDDSKKIADLLAKQDERLTKLEDAFLELYKRGDERFKAQNEKLDELRDKIGGLDGKFDKLDAAFLGLDGKFDKLDAAFLDLYKRSEERFKAIEEKLKQMPDRDRIYGALDQILKNQETDEQERLIANHQLDRHEQWIVRAAGITKVSYDPAT